MRTIQNRAFTLIELLVVVAIIAILAAIAVPNLLEAQTRAKVSRAQSDMRTIATGLETFRIDRGRYPPDAQYGPASITYLTRLKFLTTPVAYLSSVPGDPFANEGRILEYTSTKPHNPYQFPAVGGDWVYPLTYDYANRRNPDGSWEGDATWTNITRSPGAVTWALRSNGPDGWAAWLGEPVPAYDPTNGAVSFGNIYYTGPGKGPDGPAL